MIDEDKQEEVFDYFKSAEIDSIDDALVELGSDDYTREEVQLMRIKFMSEMGNWAESYNIEAGFLQSGFVVYESNQPIETIAH